jgi:hypothetical protein
MEAAGGGQILTVKMAKLSTAICKLGNQNGIYWLLLLLLSCADSNQTDNFKYRYK